MSTGFFESLSSSEDKITTWLNSVPNTWAETERDGMVNHWTQIWSELKPDYEPLWVQQYPMPLVSKEDRPPPPMAIGLDHTSPANQGALN